MKAPSILTWARRCAQVLMAEGIWNVFLSSSYGSLHVCAEKSVFCSIGSQPFGAELYLGKLCLSLTSLHLMDLIWVPLSLGFTCNKIVLTTGVSLYWLITAQVGVLFCLFVFYLFGVFLFGWFWFILTCSLLGTFSCELWHLNCKDIIFWGWQFSIHNFMEFEFQQVLLVANHSLDLFLPQS